MVNLKTVNFQKNALELNWCRYNSPIKICSKVKKSGLVLKSMAIIDPVMWWFKIMQYNENKYITIVNLVETTSLNRYPWTI